MANGKRFDTWSAIVVILTVVLFTAALFVKGFTHDLFVEAGVLLVSVKLILMAQTNARTEENLERRLLRIEELLMARTAPGNPMKQNQC
jgi:protein-S-isoprenylcysteine O-methyltransferase Ste14